MVKGGTRKSGGNGLGVGRGMWAEERERGGGAERARAREPSSGFTIGALQPGHRGLQQAAR